MYLNGTVRAGLTVAVGVMRERGIRVHPSLILPRKVGSCKSCATETERSIRKVEVLFGVDRDFRSKVAQRTGFLVVVLMHQPLFSREADWVPIRAACYDGGEPTEDVVLKGPNESFDYHSIALVTGRIMISPINVCRGLPGGSLRS